MAYQGTHYNYQVIVIFAILLGGVLLLAMVIGAIYFVCVNNMRDDERKRMRSPRPSSQVWGPPPGAVAPQQHSFQSFPYPPQAADQYTGGRPISASPAVQQYNVSQSPLVTQMPQDGMYTNQYRQLQPEVVYTQGPSGYISQTPVDYTMNREPFRTSAI
ncbi:unnamed protein product, partial [Mesorhabditis belari]|uniref:Uncharacterized protein n=1 Tax=Mesorhabditis belari TaxID=2138241 RepID=A0AAF3EBC7_9BILA